MNGFLLDTNCISEIVRVRPDPRVVEWIENAEESRLYLSVLTLGEIRKGVSVLPPGRRRNNLDEWLRVELPARFADRILPVDAAVADVWGEMTGLSGRGGVVWAVVDGLLAATAIRHELTVVTRNVKHFALWELQVINPWEAT